MLSNNLVETHCHILPGIDDGSPDVETSLKMIERLRIQGITDIILTPHYYSDAISYKDFLEKRNKAYNILKSAVGDDVNLIPAAEIYITDYLLKNENLDEICFGENRYALIEHAFASDFSQRTYDRLLNLIYDYKITPILAHVERYEALMSSERLLDEYIEAGCVIQSNVSSFLFLPRGMRKKLIKYLEKGKIHIIGSDCHNLDTRPPEYQEALTFIKSKCGDDIIDYLKSNSQGLIDK